MEQKKGFSRDFILVLIGQIISLFGNAVMRFALPIHLLNETGSAAILGVVSGCAFIPLAVMAPIGGIIADRVNKRNIMVVLDFLTAGLSGVFLVSYGKMDMVASTLIMLFLLYGIAGAYQPSVQASIPLIVAPEKIMPANAIINMVSSLAGLLGPALGGLAYSLWGIQTIVWIGAGCFFASAVMEIFIHIPFTRRPRESSVIQEVKKDLHDSIYYITREKKVIGQLTISCAAVNMVLSSLMIVGFPVIVMQRLHFPGNLGTTMYGFMQAILAVGGLVGGISAGVLSKRINVQKSWQLLILCGMLLAPVGVIQMLPVSAYLNYGVTAACGLGIMILSTLYTIQIMSYVQLSTPVALIGKVIAWIIAISTCAQPVGQVFYGFLLERLPEYIGGIIMVAAGLAILLGYYNKKISARL